MTEGISSEGRAGVLNLLHRLSFTPALTCHQAIFSFRSVEHSGGKGETKKKNAWSQATPSISYSSQHQLLVRKHKEPIKAQQKVQFTITFWFWCWLVEKISRLLRLVTSDLSDQIFNWLEKAETKWTQTRHNLAAHRVFLARLFKVGDQRYF